MIQLVTLKDMDKIKYLPIEVKKQVEQYLMILDEAYGEDRTIEDLGGFIAIVEDKHDLKLLKETYYLDIKTSDVEWVHDIIVQGTIWKEALYCLSADWSIVVIGEKDRLNLQK